jgi:hypothetical protein
MAIWSELLGVLLETLRFMPGFLLRRLYPSEKLQSALEITVRPQNPLSFSISSDVPSVSIYLQVINHSVIDLELDHLFAEMWSDSPHMMRLAICQSRERSFLRHHSSGDIYCRDFLNELQVRQIRLAQEKQLTFTLHVTAFFDTKLGKVKKEKVSIERLKAEIS